MGRSWNEGEVSYFSKGEGSNENEPTVATHRLPLRSSCMAAEGGEGRGWEALTSCGELGVVDLVSGHTEINHSGGGVEEESGAAPQ